MSQVIKAGDSPTRKVGVEIFDCLSGGFISQTKGVAGEGGV